MARIKIYSRNLLESGITTVNGNPDTGKPETRLYDRAISLFWKASVTEAKTFQVDQGAEIKSADFLAVAKHNFSGESMTWEHSENGSDWADAVQEWEQPDNEQIIKTLDAALTKEYWRVTLTSIENPQCSEIYISYGYEFQVDFVSNPLSGKIPNVVWNQAVGGMERSTKLGRARRTRTYVFFLQRSDGSLGNFRAAMDDLDEYSIPFYLKDHEGDYWLAKFAEAPVESFISEGHVTMPVTFIEVL